MARSKFFNDIEKITNDDTQESTDGIRERCKPNTCLPAVGLQKERCKPNTCLPSIGLQNYNGEESYSHQTIDDTPQKGRAKGKPRP